MATTLKSIGKRPTLAIRKSAVVPSEETTWRPIWETVAQLGAQIPDEEWQKVPEDSSVNYK